MCQDGLKILRKISFIGTFFKNTEIRNTHKENTYSKIAAKNFYKFILYFDRRNAIH